jgi:prefoldin subunit 4
MISPFQKHLLKMASVDILREDQQRINKFSYLNMQNTELQREIKISEEKVNALQDALDELEIAMEPSARVMIGETFVLLSEEEALSRLEKMRDLKKEELLKLKALAESTEKEMASLKNYLSAKFGATINLEED